MKILISPSKTLSFDSEVNCEFKSESRLIDETKTLHKILLDYTSDDLKNLMGVSNKIAELNYDRFKNWEDPTSSIKSRQAVYAFKGDVYSGLDADSINEDSLVNIITLKDDSGLEIMRHTIAAQVLARAIKNIYPEAKLAIGPTIENGFYYDVLFKNSISSDDLSSIENEMKKIVREGHSINKKIKKKNEAIKLFEMLNEPYKIQIINDSLQENDFQIYQQGDTGFFDYGEFTAEYSSFDMNLLYHMARSAQCGNLPLMIKPDQEGQGFWTQAALGAGFKAVLFTDIRTPEDVDECHRIIREDFPGVGGSMGVKLRRPALGSYDVEEYAKDGVKVFEKDLSFVPFEPYEILFFLVVASLNF